LCPHAAPDVLVLLRHPSSLQVTIIERTRHLGRGRAYAVDSPVLRLNVPAARMSMDPSQPDDFVRFAGREAAPHAFMPRRVFGDYVEASLAHAARESLGRFRALRGEAVAVEPGVVRLADGRSVAGDRIVLATGNAAPSGTCSWPDDEHVIDAWDEAACTRAASTGRILLVGAGLSSLDVLSLLASAGHRDELVFVSRHGHLPRPHAAHSGSLQIPSRLGAPPAEIAALIRWVRTSL
jgi:uncharacterized NAD(P)/FAD-binding protein YdhS